jgi:outer membrane protein TolC
MLIFFTNGYTQKKVSSVEELLEYVATKSITLQKDNIKLDQAKKAKLAAVLSVIEPVGNNTMTFVNNTKLPVSVFPAEVLGGTPGTFTEVQTGVQYTNTINQNFELKIFNLQGWENLKLSKINIELSENNNLLSLKTLQENIVINYYNIVTLQEQLKSTRINEAVADSLFKVSESKYKQGIVRQQDVNDTKVNYINTKENANQMEFLLKNYILSLKILCDISDDEELLIEDKSTNENFFPTVNVAENSLLVSNSVLNEMYAKSNFKALKKENLPTLSLIGSQSWQLFNQEFKVFDGSWINSQYVGFKIAIPLPTSKSVANTSKAKFDYELAKKSTEQAKIKSKLDYEKLIVDYDKTISQYTSNKEIYDLRKETYFKNKNLYRDGLIDIDQTLNSYNAMVNADYNRIASKVSLKLQQAKIDINNKIN